MPKKTLAQLSQEVEALQEAMGEVRKSLSEGTRSFTSIHEQLAELRGIVTSIPASLSDLAGSQRTLAGEMRLIREIMDKVQGVSH